MKKATINKVLSWDPCEGYTEEVIAGLFAGRKAMTALDMLDLDIPDEDRLWAVLREDLIDAPMLHEFACWCAEGALSEQRKRGREPDPRSWAAIAAKREWLRGETADDEALYAAESAAEDAARHAQVQRLKVMLIQYFGRRWEGYKCT
jgi:hypothetical protein